MGLRAWARDSQCMDLNLTKWPYLGEVTQSLCASVSLIKTSNFVHYSELLWWLYKLSHVKCLELCLPGTYWVINDVCHDGYYCFWFLDPNFLLDAWIFGISLGLGLPESTAELGYCGELQLCGPLLFSCLRRYLPRNVWGVIVHLPWLGMNQQAEAVIHLPRSHFFFFLKESVRLHLLLWSLSVIITWL